MVSDGTSDIKDKPDLLSAALGYTARGWYVLPVHKVVDGKCSCREAAACPNHGKHPKLKGWTAPRTWTAPEAAEWWSGAQPWNLGVLMGKPSGVWSLDIDGSEGLAELAELEVLHGELPRTPCFRTGGGGKQLLFAWPSDGSVITSGSHVERRSIDVRGHGGQSVMPPSRSGKGPYCWLVSPDETAVAEAPAWLLNWLATNGRVKGRPSTPTNGWAGTAGGRQHSGAAERKVDEALRRPEARNDSGFWLSCQLRDLGLLKSEARTHMLAYAARCPAGDHPYTTEEAMESLESAYSQEPRDPPARPGNSDGRRRASAAPGEPSQAGTAGDEDARREFNFTDRGNAERVLHRHGGDIRYCPPMNKFFVWSGRNWQQDELMTVEGRIKETQRALYLRTAGRIKELGDPAGDEEKKSQIARHMAVLKHCLAWEAQRKIIACKESMKSEHGIAISTSQLDADPFAFNCQNGTLDLKTGKLRQHRREDLLTRLSPVEFDQEASCPLWHSCLDTWMNAEPRLIDYLQRVAGYCMTAIVSEQCLWFFHGSGQNGKSVFLRTVQDVLGDYALTGVDDLLMQKRHQAHPTELACLFGRRLVLTIEQDQGRKMAEALMKKLTGEDVITARRMREDFWQFHPTHKIILAANHRPEVQGQDFAVWRRIKLVPWSVRIPDDRKDTKLLSRLRQEWPGILAWLVQGCLKWQRDGLQEPHEVTAATAAYRAEQNVIGEFLTERCTLLPDLCVRAGILHDAFEKWSSKEVTRNAFASLMEANGYRSVTDSSKFKIYKGIGLNSQSNPGDFGDSAS